MALIKFSGPLNIGLIHGMRKQIRYRDVRDGAVFIILHTQTQLKCFYVTDFMLGFNPVIVDNSLIAGRRVGSQTL